MIHIVMHVFVQSLYIYSAISTVYILSDLAVRPKCLHGGGTRGTFFAWNIAAAMYIEYGVGMLTFIELACLIESRWARYSRG